MARTTKARTIKREVVDLLKHSDAYSLPVNLIAVAEHLKIRVIEEDFDDDISGVLIIKNGKRAVGLNRSHHPNRKRFTLAHEIGHLVLHHKTFEDPNNDIHIDKKKWAYFRSASPTKGDEREYEANDFAAELLMPSELLIAHIKKMQIDVGDDDDVDRLAQTLKVSVKALTIRLIELGLVEPYSAALNA